MGSNPISPIGGNMRNYWTNAADYIRECPSVKRNENYTLKLSRREASALIEHIAKAVNMDPNLMAKKLSDYKSRSSTVLDIEVV
tara:strand:+ start:199 stop:450 length:252 start_codon:yes stop_codon:yes gene_type:complete